MSFLSKNDFSLVIKSTPSVAIDLIIEDADAKYLLGKRKNEPAKGFLFIPGGRIYKEESLEDDFLRISYSEPGKEFSITHAHFFWHL